MLQWRLRVYSRALLLSTAMWAAIVGFLSWLFG